MEVSQGFTSSRFPYLPLRVSVRQRSEAVEALVDTGFDGDVSVPPETLTAGESPDGYSPWILADGSEVLAPAYDGTVQLGSLAPFPAIVIVLGDEPVAGRGVTDRFRVILDHGRQLIIEP